LWIVSPRGNASESFWTVASYTTAAVETDELISEFFPDTERRGTFDGYETVFDISKAETLLDWVPEHSWRED
jgi:nucleoside-diphosphate-sugar epimerase